MEDKILAYIDKIPALSPTISKIVELSGSQSASASNLVQAIKLDPVLTLKIIKLINSAYFGMPQEITSINRAIVLLGMNTIKNIALSAEVLSSFNPKGGATFNVDTFWEHSLACAVAGKLIAVDLVPEKEKHEDYFIAGLIHDIGKIFLIKYFSAEYFSCTEKVENYSELTASEKKFFTMDHAEIGGLISEKWALPQDMVDSIKYHHAIEEYEGDSILPASVYLSNMFCNRIDFNGDPGITQSHELTDDDWGRLNITSEKADTILSSLHEKVDEARAFIKSG